MTRSGRRKRSTQSSISSIEENSPSFHPRKRGNVDSESNAEIMAAAEHDDGKPSLTDVWRVLTEVKANTEKLVCDVKALKESYNQLKTSLEFTQSEVESLSNKNKSLKS